MSLIHHTAQTYGTCYPHPWESLKITTPTSPYTPVPSPQTIVPWVTTPTTPCGTPSGWIIVGHCHACGNPIYAKVGDLSSPPVSHRTCTCTCK